MVVQWQTIMRAQVARKIVELRLTNQNEQAPTTSVILGPASWWDR